MKHLIFLISLIIILSFIVGCEKQKPTDPSVTEAELNKVDMESLQINENFSYRTSEDVDVRVSVFNNVDDPVPGITFTIYADMPDHKGKKIARIRTDKYGLAKIKINLPPEVKELNLVGYFQNIILPIVYNQATCHFGKYGVQSTILEKENPLPKPTSPAEPTDIKYTYVTTYSTGSTGGVPDVMTFDVLQPSFLERIDDALPEKQPVPEYNPEYLSSSNDIDLILIEDCEVWVTFITEGAGYKNGLGYYTYNTAAGYPASAEDLSFHKIIFPNASLSGSGGGLTAGDKVYLGSFTSGTSLGWFISRNAWRDPYTEVDISRTRLYSYPAYNPEAEPYNQHNVLLWDAVAEKLILGFEDLIRPGGDNDFNDAVFYVTANPPEAIDLTNLVKTVEEEDPFSFISSTTGTIGFEDKWPQQGDYDFNDLVIDYSFTEHLNGSSEITSIDASLTLRAIGAGYHNGFAIEFPFPSSGVSLENNGNTTIALESNARTIVRVFNDAYDIIPKPATSGVFVNTQNSVPHYSPVTLTFTLTLGTPIPQVNMQYTDANTYNLSIPITPPYNPFLYVQGTRSHEVHLPDYPPTSEANSSLFGTSDDASAPMLKRYYKTIDDYPWAILIPSTWDYPIERSQVTWGFLDFASWAQNNGLSAQNWYNRSAANVNISHIFIATLP